MRIKSGCCSSMMKSALHGSFRKDSRKRDVVARLQRNGSLKMMERTFDVIVLDVKMPKMDGIETLREVKKIRPLTEVDSLDRHAICRLGVKD